MEYFGIFQVQRGNLRSFHFGVTLEFSVFVLYWLLGTSVRKIANFTFSPSLFACHVKLERGKSKDVLLALPNKNLKHTRK